jgi:hypothetical protein
VFFLKKLGRRVESGGWRVEGGRWGREEGGGFTEMVGFMGE